jgi:hypothetical protein
MKLAKDASSEGLAMSILRNLLTLAIVAVSTNVTLAENPELEIRAIDKDTQEPIAVRMHLFNAKGKPVLPKNVVSWKDHFVFPGTAVLQLPPGKYTFEIQRGPEYLIRYGEFELKRGDADSKQVEMSRFVDMKAKGWWSGELHVHRPLEDVPLLMQAEDLHVAPVITWWNAENPWQKKAPEKLLLAADADHFYNVMAGEDERGGGALLYFQLDEPLPITQAEREYPSSVKFLLQAKQANPNVHVDIEKPFWWDVPLWLATGKVDSIGIAHNHMWHNGVMPDEAWGKPRDKTRYPSPLGNGRWTQDIYYNVLNCGLRIAPSAGSASGVLPNPVGYTRVYAFVDGQFTYDKWWESLRAGSVVVTNGPLMQPRVNGQLPGHVFQARAGQKVVLKTQLDLFLRDKVDYLELVQNGKAVQQVRLDEYKDKQGKLPDVAFEESGWMMVRAVSNNRETYRFAASGPYYVQIGDQPRVGRKAAQFFLDWVNERAEQLKLDDPQQREQVMKHVETARKFWQEKVDQANAE